MGAQKTYYHTMDMSKRAALEEALKWLDEHKVPYDYVNENRLSKLNYGEAIAGRFLLTFILTIRA